MLVQTFLYHNGGRFVVLNFNENSVTNMTNFIVEPFLNIFNSLEKKLFKTKNVIKQPQNYIYVYVSLNRRQLRIEYFMYV